MSTLDRTRLRLAGDAARFDAPLEVNRRATPQFWRGNDVQFELGVFNNGELQSVANLASVTVEIKALGASGSAPAASTAALMAKTVLAGALDNSLDQASWDDGSKQHALIAFTAAESAIAAGARWLTIYATTTDTTPRTITLCAGPIKVLESGAGFPSDPPDEINTYPTLAVADARYLQTAPSGGNFRFKSGNIIQVFNPDTNLYHDVFVKVVGGVPTLMTADTGEA